MLRTLRRLSLFLWIMQTAWPAALSALCTATQHKARMMDDDYEDLQDTYPGAGTFQFGDSEEMCQALIALVRQGNKRATCGAKADFADDPGAMPVVGRCDIAANWDGSAAVVIRTTKVVQVRFCDVTWDMARREGENDDLAGWQADHRAYFARNGGFDPQMMLVFEYFEVVEDLEDRGLVN